jgi:RNA polymerase sigma-B factor
MTTAESPDQEESKEESVAEFTRFAATRDPELRDRLVERFLPLSSGVARRFTRRGEPRDDLEQVAALALVKAVDRFDPTRDVAFETYAVRSIAGELKRHFRDRAWSVRPPRRIQERCLELNRALEERTQALGRAPTIRELAEACATTEDDVIEALDAAESYWTVSLDLPTPDGETMGVHIGGDDHELEAVERRVTLVEHLAVLAPRDREIVRLRFVDGLTQSEIAERVGLSQMHVSRLLRGALTELRTSFRERRLVDVADLTE